MYNKYSARRLYPFVVFYCYVCHGLCKTILWAYGRKQNDRSSTSLWPHLPYTFVHSYLMAICWSPIFSPTHSTTQNKWIRTERSDQNEIQYKWMFLAITNFFRVHSNRDSSNTVNLCTHSITDSSFACVVKVIKRRQKAQNWINLQVLILIFWSWIWF